MKNLIIVGAGGFGRELLQWVKEINAVEKKWEIAGFLDDNPAALDGRACDYQVIGSISDWSPGENEEFVLAIANPRIKEIVVGKLLEKGAQIVSVIHPDAHIGAFSKIGKGVVLYPASRVTVNAVVGDYVTVLDQAVIGHDVSVGNYTTICGSCGINGQVTLGEKVFVGSHATVVPGRKIGDEAYIGAGSLVVANVKAGNRVFGVPARKIRI